MLFGTTSFSELTFSNDPFHNAIVSATGQEATITSSTAITVVTGATITALGQEVTISQGTPTFILDQILIPNRGRIND